ncbi:hypothetical protein LTR95_010851 [Oleoguttula sp. CCFEE 5521]
MSVLKTTALLGSFAASVYAHGYVSGYVVDGQYIQGYSKNFQWQRDPPVVAGWSTPEVIDTGFIGPQNYTTPQIICHLDATPGGTSVKIAAGSEITLQWTPWPVSHHGPVIDYLARCSGNDCTAADKTKLEFFKFAEAGLIEDLPEKTYGVTGKWASDDLIANNNSWVVKIPSDISPGPYVLRHEIIALHSAHEVNGAQNYPQCVNLEITGSGTASPTGITGDKLYPNTTAPGIFVSIYQHLGGYEIPGPALYSTGNTPSASPPVVASTAAVTSAPATSAASSIAKPETTSPSSEVPTTFQTTGASPTASSVVAPEASSAAAPPSSAYSAPSSVAAPSTAASTAVPAATSAPDAPPAPDTTCTSIVAMPATVTTEVYTTITSAPDAISAIADTVPSSALTATISQALPSPAAFGNSSTSGSAAPGYPSKPLPEGFTLKDVLEWAAYLLGKAFSQDGNKMKRHARDLAVAA